MTTEAQLDHIKQHLDAFEEHTGTRDVEQYFADYDRDGLYEGVCNDLGLTPDEATYKLELPRDQVDTLLVVLWHHVTPAMGLDQSLHDEIEDQVRAQGGKPHA